MHKKKPAVQIPSRLKPFMHFGQIPRWGLLAMILSIVIVIAIGSLSPDIWSHRIFNFAGQQGSAVVVAKRAEPRIKAPTDYIIEASLITTGSFHQFYEFRVTGNYYDAIQEGSEFAIVYDPNKPERAYPMHGKAPPAWLFYVIGYLIFPTLIIATIVRYRKVLYRKL